MKIPRTVLLLALTSGLFILALNEAVSADGSLLSVEEKRGQCNSAVGSYVSASPDLASEDFFLTIYDDVFAARHFSKVASNKRRVVRRDGVVRLDGITTTGSYYSFLIPRNGKEFIEFGCTYSGKFELDDRFKVGMSVDDFFRYSGVRPRNRNFVKVESSDAGAFFIYIFNAGRLKSIVYGVTYVD